MNDGHDPAEQMVRELEQRIVDAVGRTAGSELNDEQVGHAAEVLGPGLLAAAAPVYAEAACL